MKFSKYELDVMKIVARDEGLPYKLLKSTIATILKDEEKEKAEALAKIKPIDKLTYDEIKLLRDDVVLGSIYISDYSNRYGYDAHAICNIMEGFIEEIDYLIDENGGNFEDYDTPEELYNYINSIEFSDEELEEMTKEARQEIEEEYNTRNKIFDEEEIYSIAHGLQWTMFDAILKGV